MKKNIISIICLCVLHFHFQQKVIKSDRIEAKGNVIYEIGQKTPFTGVLENYDEKGVLDARAEFKNGVMDGYSKLYYPSGKLSSEATFKNGVQVGIQKDYYEDGKLKMELNYKMVNQKDLEEATIQMEKYL